MGIKVIFAVKKSTSKEVLHRKSLHYDFSYLVEFCWHVHGFLLVPKKLLPLPILPPLQQLLPWRILWSHQILLSQSGSALHQCCQGCSSCCQGCSSSGLCSCLQQESRCQLSRRQGCSLIHRRGQRLRKLWSRGQGLH